MAGRSRPSFTKRQKEHARQEKQRAKAERRLQRKLEKTAGGEQLSTVPSAGMEGPAAS
ncbi:MAG TPA: hypothetical protein VGQ71_08125 [Terriglobales bacterium]|jgi:hypothetical protein|nr:hypothetical protein [Terriglobales bacterium]